MEKQWRSSFSFSFNVMVSSECFRHIYVWKVLFLEVSFEKRDKSYSDKESHLSTILKDLETVVSKSLQKLLGKRFCWLKICVSNLFLYLSCLKTFASGLDLRYGKKWLIYDIRFTGITGWYLNSYLIVSVWWRWSVMSSQEMFHSQIAFQSCQCKTALLNLWNT